ncbi:Uncharacterized protein LSUE1_G002646 [Lachnellula suecica]|uniref:SUN domain-containing protein n=1 Tax=Lachnellula suecica TaxID=602035 RepID=A0A8T9CLP2_9HELO|nr:Uncharacterized protein LSUE1_G002646 [Lachnellula suecica]
MLLVCPRIPATAWLLLLLSYAPRPIVASTITTAPQATPPAANLTATCEFRTINYITDSLPQLCFRSSWTNANGTSSTKLSENTTVISEGSEGPIVTSSASPDVGTGTTEGTPTAASEAPSISSSISSQVVQSTAPSTDELEPSELNEDSFLSFEEWKKQALEKAGQANANIGSKKSGTGENKRRESESLHNHLDSIGDDGEIDLDFGSFRDGENVQETPQNAEGTRAETPDEPRDVGKGEKRRDHRSKDAGITCKERFSYASFDAGATVLKTHSGAKNSKAILIENKDSYMLSECSAQNKFVIIELSEDIWIDTVVLANYEFFSSMVRTFRVSVSDRYPVKMEKWKDAGTYEARNSRDIQAFLIGNPQIWARYLRIEFMSHYGNEYYCPLSLVRVHGTRMLESWKETEAIGEEEDSEENEDTTEEHFVPDAVADVVQEEEKLNAELRAQAEKVVKESIDLARENRTAAENAEQMFTPWTKPIFAPFPQSESWETNVCLMPEAPVQRISATKAAITQTNMAIDSRQTPETPGSVPENNTSAPVPSAATQHDATANTSALHTPSSQLVASDTPVSSTTSDATAGSPSVNSSQPAKAQNTTVPHRNRTATASAASALPTIQESFFKAVSRRLQLLETNSTLSLGYIEQQSKILREAFSKVEKKQLQKSTSFLDTLNNTVLAELRGFRQQYDEIWQSTVISLESQREESRREVLAISSRLNILADEVVFQKRMSIVQSVLLLLCLGLVIFSRVSAGGPLDFPTLHSRSRNLSDYPIESPLLSPPDSPSFHGDETWLERQEPGVIGISRPTSRDDDAPPTPVSTYSRSDAGFTPPSGLDDQSPDFVDSRPHHLEPPSSARPTAGSRSSTFEGPGSPLSRQLSGPQLRSRSSTLEAASRSPLHSPSNQSSPTRTPQKQKSFPLLPTSPSAAGIGAGQHYYTTPGVGIWQEVDEQSGAADDSSRLSSPRGRADELKPAFSIVRKPLPSLPRNGE